MIKTNQIWQVGTSRFIIGSVGETKSNVFVVSLGKTSSVTNTFFTRLGTLVWSDEWQDAN